MLGSTPRPAPLGLWPGRQTGKAASPRGWCLCGFDSHLGDCIVPSSSGQDACITRRRAQVRVLPGRLGSFGPQVLRRHASVVGRRFGFESRADLWFEEEGLLVQQQDACLARRRSGCDSPAVHWRTTGPWSNGTTPPSRGGDPGSTPGGSTASARSMGSWSNRRTPPWRGGGPGAIPGDSIRVRRKARDLASNPVASGAPLTGLWVRVPRLPLRGPGSETEIPSRS